LFIKNEMYQPLQPQQQTYDGNNQNQNNNQPITHNREQKFVTSAWKDVGFTVMFVLHLIGFFIFFVIAVAKNPNGAKSEFEKYIPQDVELFRKLITVIVSCAAFGIAISFIALLLLRKFARVMIIASLVVSVLLWLGIALVSFMYGSYIYGFFVLIMAIFIGICMITWRNRIPFATEMLKTITKLTAEYPGTVYLTYTSILFQLGWALFWLFGVSLMGKFPESQFGIIAFFLLVSFYWTSQVIKNVVHVSCAGVYATWYFLTGDIGMPRNPTLGALKRSMTFSFGSICFGSLIVAVIKALRALVHGARGQGNQFVKCIIECLLGILDRLVQYFNHYAFTVVAIYGRSYCEASSQVWDLLHSDGIEAIINDDIIGSVLGITSLTGGALTSIFGGLLGYSLMPGGYYWVSTAILGFLIGFVLVAMTMEVIDSGVASIFVCFALDPLALYRTDPQLYQRFKTTYSQWCNHFPQ